MTNEKEFNLRAFRRVCVKAAGGLNAAVARADSTVQRIKQFLTNECGLSITAGLSLESVRIDGMTEEATYLSFDTFAGKHGIGIERIRYRDEGDRNNFLVTTTKSLCRTAWSRLSQDEKAKAYPMLPDLLREICTAASNEAQELLTSVEKIESMLKRG